MTLLQAKQIIKLKKEISNISKRIKFNCWDCMGQQNYKHFDCKNPECAFYDIRPKSLHHYHPPKKGLF